MPIQHIRILPKNIPTFNFRKKLPINTIYLKYKIFLNISLHIKITSKLYIYDGFG